jgi:hypothetical protein
MMATTIVLAVFIASATTFEAGVAVDSAFHRATFPNSTQGIEQLGKWLDKSGLTEFDHVCVSGPPMAATPVSRFWSSRKVPVVLMDYSHVKTYMGEHRIAKPSAEIVAKACAASLPAVPVTGQTGR